MFFSTDPKRFALFIFYYYLLLTPSCNGGNIFVLKLLLLFILLSLLLLCTMMFVLELFSCSIQSSSGLTVQEQKYWGPEMTQ